MLAPVPAATQDKLAKWVDGHVDALVKELTPEDGTAVLAVKGASAGGDDKEDGNFSTSSMDGGDKEGEAYISFALTCIMKTQTYSCESILARGCPL